MLCETTWLASTTAEGKPRVGRCRAAVTAAAMLDLERAGCLEWTGNDVTFAEQLPVSGFLVDLVHEDLVGRTMSSSAACEELSKGAWGAVRSALVASGQVSESRGSFHRARFACDLEAQRLPVVRRLRGALFDDGVGGDSSGGGHDEDARTVVAVLTACGVEDEALSLTAMLDDDVAVRASETPVYPQLQEKVFEAVRNFFVPPHLRVTSH